MKKIILLAAIMTAFGITTAEAQIKRVLLEQYTGAWCGWCVDGTVKMDKLLELYPDRVIGLKLHINDSMSIADGKIIQKAFTVSGVPSGSLDKRMFGGHYIQDRASWKLISESLFLNPAKVEVNSNYSIDEVARQLKVRVYATMSQTVSDSLNFNVVITEDSVSGSGDGWDQKNYLANMAGYEDTPFYKLPMLIEGYKHVKVARAFLGGPWGVQGTFPVPAKQGETYVYDFSYDLPLNWNINNLKIIALVQVNDHGNKEALNCTHAIKEELSMRLTSNDPVAGVRGIGQTIEKTFQLKNMADSPQVFTISIEKSRTTPKDWTAEIEGSGTGEITLGPNETKELKLKLTPGTTMGVGEAMLKVLIKNLADSPLSTGTLHCASNEISNIEVLPPGENPGSLIVPLKAIGYKDFITLTSDQHIYFGELLKAGTYIWNSGLTGAFSKADIAGISKAQEAGVPLLVCGTQSAYNLATDNLLNAYSIPQFKAEYIGHSDRTFGRIWLAGDSLDAITENFGSKIEGIVSETPVNLLKSTDDYRSRPFLHYASDTKRIIYNSTTKKLDTFNILAKDAIFGLRYQDIKRSILLSVHPNVIDIESKRNETIDRMIKWIRYEITDVEEQQTLTSDFSISPIPADAYITLKFEPSNSDEILIYNSLGNLMQRLSDPDNSGQISYNSGNLPSGVYTAVIKSGAKASSRKFVIAR